MPPIRPDSVPIDIKRRRRAGAEPELAPGMGLEIRWSGGEICYLSSTLLRTNCPCAECLERRGQINHAKPLSEPKKTALRVISATIDQETNLVTVWAIGNYAIGIRWADRHDSGIYSYALLRQLAENAPES